MLNSLKELKDITTIVNGKSKYNNFVSNISITNLIPNTPPIPSLKQLPFTI